MGDFGAAERRILEFMSKGTEFVFNGKGYTVMLSGKPTCHKGEPKTDIYILAESCEDEVEIKISYKKENADFIENKMSAERAEQLFGEDWIDIIEHSTTAIQDKFYERMLIYKNGFRRTEKGSITLGWKFELLNKSGGDLSGKMLLTDEQVVDVYAGSNLSPDKKNASVCGQIIRDSGVANYILMDENVYSAQDVIDKMIPIREYVMMHPDIYFACKALNYRTFAEKIDLGRKMRAAFRRGDLQNAGYARTRHPADLAVGRSPRLAQAGGGERPLGAEPQCSGHLLPHGVGGCEQLGCRAGRGNRRSLGRGSRCAGSVGGVGTGA